LITMLQGSKYRSERNAPSVFSSFITNLSETIRSVLDNLQGWVLIGTDLALWLYYCWRRENCCSTIEQALFFRKIPLTFSLCYPMIHLYFQTGLSVPCRTQYYLHVPAPMIDDDFSVEELGSSHKWDTKVGLLACRWTTNLDHQPLIYRIRLIWQEPTSMGDTVRKGCNAMLWMHDMTVVNL
jgi:hypothetical protein